MRRQKKHSVTIEAIKEQSAGEIFYPIISLFSFVLGICGFFLIIDSYIPYVYNEMILFVALPLLGVGLWYINQEKKKLVHGLYFFIIGACVLYFFVNRKEFLYEADLLVKALDGTGTGAAASDLSLFKDMSCLMFFFAVLSAYMMFFLVYIIKAEWAAAVISLLLILVCPIVGKTPSILGIAFLIIFFTISSFTVETNRSKKKKIQSGHNWIAAGRNSSVFTGLLIISFICAGIFSVLFSDSAARQMVKLDEFLAKTYEKLFLEEDGQNGFISRGNLYQDTDNIRLTVTVTKKPTETIYLKAFQGNIYTGGSWREDADAYEENSSAEAKEFFSVLPFVLNSDAKFFDYRWYGYGSEFLAKLENQENNLRKITISGISSDEYCPYFAYPFNPLINMGDTYQFYYYYESSELETDFMKSDSTGNIQDLVDKYIDYAKSSYLEVPEERIPRLAALCRENPCDTVQEITQFIKSSLSSLASYTTTPGMAPANQDIVEYTFFERGQGYCVHFASAAVLMYRMYGIPARYVSGYAIKPSEFSRQSGGSYAAYPTGGNSHAWVEICLDGMGWIPVEVTPAYPGNNLISEKENPTVKTNPATTAAKEPASMQEQQSGQTNGELKDSEETSGISLQEIRDKFIILLKILVIPALVLVVVLAVISLMCHRRKLLLKRQKGASVRVLFFRMLQICGMNGMLKGYIGLEDDFADVFSEKFPLVRKNETAEMLRIIHNAAYGDIKPEKEEQLYVLKFYRRIADSVYETLNPLQKFWFKWIKVWN